jgi:hypothetical protein
VRIHRSDLPPMGAGWAAQPSDGDEVRAMFPELPWLWESDTSAYWHSIPSEWIVVTDMALVGRPAVFPRWVGPYARGGHGLWRLLPAGTSLRFVRRGISTGRSMQPFAMISLATDRQETLRYAVAEQGRMPDLQPPLWALLATALIAPADHPLATAQARFEPLIARAAKAADAALAALHPQDGSNDLR